MVSLKQAFVALVVIGLLMLIGRVFRERAGIFRRLFIPSSIIAGFLGLFLGAQVLGVLAVKLGGPDSFLAQGLFPAWMGDTWRALPGILINVVFAALFLGERIPKPREIWLKAGPQVAFGQILAWGQYVVGLSAALLILVPFFEMDPMVGALIEIAFEGGHGTAAGMADSMRKLGFVDGPDLAYGLATVGVVMGVVLGTILINWGVRRGYLQINGDPGVADREAISAREDRAFEVQPHVQDPTAEEEELQTTDPLSLQFGMVGLAIAIGWLLHQGLLLIESLTWLKAGGPEIMSYVPLFPLAMLGGVLLQGALDLAGHGHSVDRRLMNRISGAALDFIIVSALATLSLGVLGENLIPFLLLAALGIAWNVSVLVLLAPRIMPDFWFERGIADFGQSMGVTATGLLLLRMSDPPNRSGAWESFGYKQLLTEPFVGGGLFTAAAIPLIHTYGAVSVLAITTGLLAFWLAFGLLVFGRRNRRRQIEASSGG